MRQMNGKSVEGTLVGGWSMRRWVRGYGVQQVRRAYHYRHGSILSSYESYALRLIESHLFIFVLLKII